MFSYNTRYCRSSGIFELWQSVLLNDSAHLLRQTDLFRRVGLKFALMSAKILKKLGISRNLLDSIKERKVDFNLLKDL